MPRASMDVSTIRTPAGKAAGCGARTATARPGSRKAARAQCRAPCTSSFGPIRWRTEVRGKFERPAARGCDAFAQPYNEQLPKVSFRRTPPVPPRTGASRIQFAKAVRDLLSGAAIALQNELI